MTKNNKKFNYSLLGIVVAITGVLVTALANYTKIVEVWLSPENSIKCSCRYILYSSSLWTFI